MPEPNTSWCKSTSEGIGFTIVTKLGSAAAGRQSRRRKPTQQQTKKAPKQQTGPCCEISVYWFVVITKSEKRRSALLQWQIMRCRWPQERHFGSPPLSDPDPPRAPARTGTPSRDGQRGNPKTAAPQAGGPSCPHTSGPERRDTGVVRGAASARGGTDTPARTKRRFFRAAGDHAAPPIPASRQRPPPRRKRPHISITEGALMGHGAKTHPRRRRGEGRGSRRGAGGRSAEGYGVRRPR